MAISLEVEPIDQILKRCFFPDPSNEILNLAVSGGSDSLCLASLAVAVGHKIKIWHLDHKIRDSSFEEAHFVSEFAEMIGAQFQLVEVSVKGRSNLEARARNERKSAFPQGIATGHTMDDQAETLLLNLLRGSGMRGLSAMARDPTKPILTLRKSETIAICSALRLNPVIDSSNFSPDFLRNRIRNEVIPLLAQIAHRDIVPIFDRTATLLFDEDRYLDSLALCLDVTSTLALCGADSILRRRALRLEIERRTGYPPSLAQIEELEGKVLGRLDFRIQLPRGLEIAGRRGAIDYKTIE